MPRKMSPSRTLSVILRISGTGISENDLKILGELFLASLTKDADLPLRHAPGIGDRLLQSLDLLRQRIKRSWNSAVVVDRDAHGLREKLIAISARAAAILRD